jgi:hypothetical protein
MMNRRRFLQQAVSLSLVAGIAGCTGDNTTDSPEDDNDTQEPTEKTSSQPEQTESGPPEPETGWQEYLPHCSTGEFTFRVRGVEGNTVSIKNMGVESLELSSVSVVYGEVMSDDDVRENSETIHTDVVIEGGNSESFEFDGSYPSDDPITRIGLSTTGLEGRDESEDQLCWGQP